MKSLVSKEVTLLNSVEMYKCFNGNKQSQM